MKREEKRRTLGPDKLPDQRGRFGRFGGQYVPETLMAALSELKAEYNKARKDPEFQKQLSWYLRYYAGRPSPLYYAKRFSERIGAKVYFKREDLNHTGAHKINNTLGQGLLTVRMGKKRIIAETGAGQHGVATATAAAALGLECDVYMGTEDIRRQELNVYRMKLLGTRVLPVDSGSRTLKDAVNEAMRDWMGSVEYSHYCLGSVMGPDPFPRMVRDFQAVIGKETREQVLEAEGRLPDVLVACVGGGSNAAGMFAPMIDNEKVRMIGVEAGGYGLDTFKHAAALLKGKPGILHGMESYVLQDEEGHTQEVHSVAAGLDYPGVGPEHSYWYDTGRVEYVAVTDQEAMEAFGTLAQTEGLIPALESAHAVAYVLKMAGELPKDTIMVINLSGRGDKDCMEVARLLGSETSQTKGTK